MHRLIITSAVAAAALAGCGDGSASETAASKAAVQAAESVAGQAGNTAQYEIKIADVDFFDLPATQALAQSLDPADTYAFLLYAMAWKASKVSGDETEIRDASGALPVTVRDAVAIQQALLAAANG